MALPLLGRLTSFALPLLLATAATGETVASVAPWLTGAIATARERADDPPGLLLAVHDFYERRAGRPAWTDASGQLTARGRAAVVLLGRAADHGLPPERYAVAASSSGELDVRLSYLLLRHARDLGTGRWPGREPMVLWRRAGAGDTSGRVLDLVARDLRALEAMAPRHEQYERLRRAHATYRRLAATGGWAELPPRLRARTGATGPWVADVVRRLRREGDLRELRSPTRLDAHLAKALRRFQGRYGLEETGAIDAATVAAWNVPVEERLRQIEVNLERWRWLPRELGERHLLVNIPTFELQAIGAGRRLLRMNVVVGAADTPTPVFSTQASSVVFRPWWNVPASIAQGELLPLLRRDVTALSRRGIVRTGNVLRQRPGAGNALGLVKVTLEDTPGIYLHDTPQDALFARRARAFSHGCIRLERPQELARLLLDGTGWDAARIRAATARGPQRDVPLDTPWPVHIVYFTTWVDDDGSTRFVPDVYGHDALQARVLWETARR